MKEFAKGDYVIVSDLVQGFGTFYDPGDKITLELEKGKGVYGARHRMDAL